MSPDQVDIDTVAHECLHAVWAMVKWTGARLDEEIVAYHLGFLVGRVFEFAYKK